MSSLVSLLGIFVFIGFSYLLSSHRKQVDKRVIINGLALQFALAILVLGIPAIHFNGPLQFLLQWANVFFLSILSFTEQGTNFLLGPFSSRETYGFVFAIHALPTIIFFSSLMAVLYHLNIMQKIVKALAFVMFKILRTSGAESLAMAANVFIGQTEAPIVVRPYVKNMTKSELMTLMTGGMATIAGSVLAAFVGLLQFKIPNIAGHLLTASVMSAPAAFLFSKIIYPETETPLTLQKIPDELPEQKSVNIIEAAAKGASSGMKMAINVAAMLLAFIALIATLNGVLGYFGELINFNSWGRDLIPEAFISRGQAGLSLQLMFSWVFAPVAWLMGIPWSDCFTAGALLGEKIVINEFVAYVHLSELTEQLSERSLIILSYALCGFANFSSIAIQIGGIGELAPSRKSELAQFGIKAMIGGSLAAFTTASIVSLFI